MPASTQPIGQSLFDFLNDGKQNGQSPAAVSSASPTAQAVQASIPTPPGQASKLTVGSTPVVPTAQITGTQGSNVAATVVLGQKTTTSGQPDLVGTSTPTTVITSPTPTTPVAGLPNLTPTAASTNDAIFKTYKNK